MGHSKQGFQFLQQLEQSVQKIGDESKLATAFVNLAEATGEMGHSEQGLLFLQQLEQSAQKKIAAKFERAQVFQSLAKAAGKLGKTFPEEINRFLSTLESHTSNFEQKSQDLAIHLNGLSQAYADLGNFRKAFALADQIEDKYPEKVFALIHLQKRYKERGKK
ncbi:MAG: hypothetical protein H7246_16065 [Phycisphaerae bacterium]|nr:hypothetical protein [Saprospiraceae bacterium]